jgi:cytochrome c
VSGSGKLGARTIDMNRMQAAVFFTCAAVLLGAAPAAMAQGQPATPAVFAPCSVCHSVDGGNGVGPSLKGVVGRKAGTLPGFRYSRGMRASTVVWDAVSLDKYLTDPQSLVPGNVMPFAGVIDPKARAELIAFLQTLK